MSALLVVGFALVLLFVLFGLVLVPLIAFFSLVLAVFLAFFGLLLALVGLVLAFLFALFLALFALLLTSLGLFLALYVVPETVWAVREEDGAWTLYGRSRKLAPLFAEQFQKAVNGRKEASV